MNIKMNLQLFSGEKTEKPTYKKRMDAREEGQIVQSKEINTVVILFASFLALRFAGGFISKELSNFMVKVFSNLDFYEEILDISRASKNNFEIISIIGILTAPVLFAVFLASLIVTYSQVGFIFTTKPLKWKLDRLNPISGFKRIFSKKALIELVKSVLKILLVGYVSYSYAYKEMSRILNYPNLSSISFYINLSALVYEFAIRMLGVLLALSLADYFFQWREHEKNLMMSKEEIKEEYKQSEGDPFIKGKIKEKQRQMAMSRMMQDVQTADVIITNPTHYAVAIKYDADLYDAPYLVAKGKDIIAKNIKEVAKESDIPIVENKPLARAIYAQLDINDFIPEDLYEAIAEVLAYVYSLRNN